MHRYGWLLPVALFAAAAILRVWGIGWSLPYVIHPDEPVMVDTAISMIKRGSLNPDFFEYPSLFLYWQYALTRVWLAWRGLTGNGIATADLPSTSHIFTLTTDLYLWGRFVAALFGAAGIVLTYYVGKRLFNWRVGLFAAMLLLVSPTHAEHSHYIEVDIMMWTLATAVLLAAYYVSIKGAGHYWLALVVGLLVGLCTGAKYTGLATLGVVGLGWIVSLFPAGTRHEARGTSEVPRNRWLDAGLRLLLIGVGTAVGFVVSTPYFLLDNRRFNESFNKQADFYEPVSTLAQYWGNISDYWNKLLPGEWFIIVPGIIGAVVLLLRDWRRGLLIGLLPPVYLLIVSRLQQTYPRNGYLAVVFLAFGAAYLLDVVTTYLSQRLVRERSRRGMQLQSSLIVRYAAVISPIMVLLPLLFVPARQTINFDRYLSLPDAAFTAQSWMEGQRVQGKRFVAELHPYQFRDWPDVRAIFTIGTNQRPASEQPPAYYADLGYDYIVFSSDNDKQRKAADRDYLADYLKLGTVRTFAGDKLGGKGPDLTVVQLGRGFEQLAVQQRISTRFGDLAQLRGYDVGPITDTQRMFSYDPANQRPLHPGDALALNLYLQAAIPDGKDWTLFIHILNDKGEKISQIDVPTRYGATIPHPTSGWHAGEYIIGSYSLPILANTPSGDYRIAIGFYDPASFSRLPATGDGAQADGAVILGGLRIED